MANPSFPEVIGIPQSVEMQYHDSPNFRNWVCAPTEIQSHRKPYFRRCDDLPTVQKYTLVMRPYFRAGSGSTHQINMDSCQKPRIIGIEPPRKFRSIQNSNFATVLSPSNLTVHSLWNRSADSKSTHCASTQDKKFIILRFSRSSGETGPM